MNSTYECNVICDMAGKTIQDTDRDDRGWSLRDGDVVQDGLRPALCALLLSPHWSRARILRSDWSSPQLVIYLTENAAGKVSF